METHDIRPPNTRVLLADDDPVIRLALSEDISNDRFRIGTASNGAITVTACAKRRYDLAIIDRELPVTSGPDLARQLKFEFGVPFIFLTASDDVQTVSAAAQPGAPGYLLKPDTPGQVSTGIEASLSRSRES